MKKLTFFQQQLRHHAAETISDAARRPARAGSIAFIAVLFSWLVLAKSLPFALAETAPDLALRLNPNHPVALLTLADRAYARLLALPPADEPATTATNVSAPETDAAVQPADGNAGAEAREALRAEIRSLTERVIAVDRLNAHAFHLLAEVTDDPARVRALMQEAVKCSRRESAAVFWLMNDSFERSDFADVIEDADVLLRTRRQLAPAVMSYLAEVAAVPEGRALLTARLARNPPWRASFFDDFPQNVHVAGTPLDLMLALKEAGSPPSVKELAPYLNFLVSKNLTGLAHEAWLQFLPLEKLTSLGLLNNPGFADDPSGLPFDWQIARGMNAIVEFVRVRESDEGRGIRFNFGVGRVTFPEASQILMLAPGHYRLTGEFQGLMVAKRGLRWQVRCAGGKKSNLAETEMIYGHPRSPETFALDVDVPAGEDCQAQQLRLFHDARSASEELISGEILFRQLSLARLDS
jgi:hypothetical protein